LGIGHTSYLSSTTCDEIITLMTTQVTNAIIKGIKSAKYFSIVIDSTPDINHFTVLKQFLRLFWNAILEHFNSTSKELQKVNTDLGKVVKP